MTEIIRSVKAYADALTKYYRAQQREIRRVCGKGSRRRRRHMSPDWQLRCSYSKYYGARLHDLFMVYCKAAEDWDFNVPISITEDRMALVECYLEEQGLEVRNRIESFKTALRSIPSEHQSAILGPGPYPWLFRNRTPRSVNAEAGTFARLEADGAAWSALACAPLVGIFEQREPLEAERAAYLLRMLSCAATMLLSKQAIGADVSLVELVSKANFDRWRNACDDDSPTVTLATIEAFVRVRTDLVHDDDDDDDGDGVVVDMRAQRTDLRDNNALPQRAREELVQMLSMQAQMDMLPAALMMIATSTLLPDPGRLRLANVAAGLGAAFAYALRPAAIRKLAHDESYRVVTSTHLARAAVDALPQFEGCTTLFAQRQEIRKAVGAGSSRSIMVEKMGRPLDAQSCAQALSRTLREFGLPSFPWQRPRDYAAVRWLLAEPTALQKVADLLEYESADLLWKRYEALLPRRPNGPTIVGQPGTGGRQHGSGR